MFYFASYEYTDRLTENLVTSPTAPIYLPDDPIVFEQPFTNPQFIGKIDVNLSSANTLALRYRRRQRHADWHGHWRHGDARARPGSRARRTRTLRCTTTGCWARAA